METAIETKIVYLPLNKNLYFTWLVNHESFSIYKGINQYVGMV